MAVNWTDREMIEQWRLLFKGSVLIQRFMATALLSQAELNMVMRSLPC
jgi:hypothetical protein